MANISATFDDSILCGTRVLALYLKTYPRTDGQGGDNIDVVVYQPSSVKARHLNFHERIYFYVFTFTLLWINILDLCRVLKKTGCLGQIWVEKQLLTLVAGHFSSGTAAGGGPPPVRNRSFLSEASRFMCFFFSSFFQQASSCLRVLLVTLASALYLFVFMLKETCSLDIMLVSSRKLIAMEDFDGYCLLFNISGLFHQTREASTKCHIYQGTF